MPPNDKQGRDPYVYPGTDVLINKEGIKDRDQAVDFERRMTAQRLIEDPPIIDFTAAGYRLLHHHIFQDVYAWAGQDRTIDVIKNDDYFCRAAYIDTELTRRFKLLADENFLRDTNVDHFARRTSEHLAELNAIHPFRESNGRTQRLFLEILAERAGHDIDMLRIRPKEWNEAARESFRSGDTGRLYALLAEALRKGRDV